ncbi:MAG: ArsR family transcriptional regulator [Thiobacillaceae bacterium]|jgi:hypothetical protein|nr:ArsR family transcriptional regulator [Thiobacillaceae bacterium]
MTIPYTELLREDRRLCLLQHLAGAADYTAHAHLLRQGLTALGQPVSFDALRADLAWLDEQGLIVLADGEVPVATLTLRGEDCARGLTRVPGVARKRPGGGA